MKSLLNSETVCSLAEEEKQGGGGEDEEEKEEDHLKGNELHRIGHTALNLQRSCS